MRLTEAQIKEFSLGCIECTKEKSGYTYARFTPGQVEGYGKRAERFPDRCRRTSGVRIDFDTDSRAVTVGVAAAGRYEIIVDGLAVAYKVCSATDAVHANMPEGNKHVTIMLPWNGRGVIDFVQVDEGAYIRHHDFAHKFLFLGDSITQGSTAIRPSCTYVDRVARWFDANYLNLGVGGTKFFPELLIKPDFEPDTVFIAFGTNDFNSSPKEMFERECKEYMDTIKSWYPDKTVYVISPSGDWIMICFVPAVHNRMYATTSSTRPRPTALSTLTAGNLSRMMWTISQTDGCIPMIWACRSTQNN